MTASDRDIYPSTTVETRKLSRRKLLTLAVEGIFLASVVGCSSDEESDTPKEQSSVDVNEQQAPNAELFDEFYEYQRDLATTIIDFVSDPNNDGQYFQDPINIEAGRSAMLGFGNMLRDSSEEQLAIGYVALINNDKLDRVHPGTLYSIEAEILNGSKNDPKCMSVQLPIGGETAALVAEWEKSGADITPELLKEWVRMRDGQVVSRIYATLSEDPIERVNKMIAYSDFVPPAGDPEQGQWHIDYFKRTADACSDEMGLKL